jgi:hypothetical protein
LEEKDLENEIKQAEEYVIKIKKEYKTFPFSVKRLDDGLRKIKSCEMLKD